MKNYGSMLNKLLVSYSHSEQIAVSSPPSSLNCAVNCADCAPTKESEPYAAAIDGTDGNSWHLPLEPLSATSLEPHAPGRHVDVGLADTCNLIVICCSVASAHTCVFYSDICKICRLAGGL